MRAVFRCDATTETGFGHLSRCIALAEALRLSGVRNLFAGLYDNAAKDQLTASGFDWADLPGPVNTEGAERQFAEMMARGPAGFIVVDSYRVDEDYLAGLQSLGCATVVIDDFGALKTYTCDVVLNFTWQAASLGYADGPVLLLGPDYFPARRQLVELRPRSVSRRRSGTIRNLLIAVGGADPKRIAARLTRILREDHSDICLRVIAANDADLAGMVSGFAPGSQILPRQPDLSEQFLWADAATTGGGLIKYESAFMAVPAAAISQNEGQAGETRSLTRAGLVFDLGLADERSDEELARVLDRFLADSELRHDLAERMRDTFAPDPSAHAARAIVEAVGR